jgi:hypothetical protein
MTLGGGLSVAFGGSVEHPNSSETEKIIAITNNTLLKIVAFILHPVFSLFIPGKVISGHLYIDMIA